MTHEAQISSSSSDAEQSFFNAQGQFTELHYFRNPVCSNAQSPRANPDRFRKTYEQHGLKVYVHETSIDPEETIANIDGILADNVVLGVASGDGGTGDFLDDVIEAKKRNPNLRSLDPPVLIVPAGNKNDMGHTVHSKLSFESPELMLMRGVARAVSPLEISRWSHEENRGYNSLDFAYNTYGISGDTSAAVNRPDYRNQRLLAIPGGRFVAERREAVRSYLRAESFGITTNPGTTQAESYEAFELMFANGPNMAGTLHPDVSFFESEARIVEVRNRLMGFTTLSAMSRGLPVGELFDREDGVKTYDLTVPPDTTIWGQRNGEAYQLVEGGHRLTMGISRMAVSVLTLVA